MNSKVGRMYITGKRRDLVQFWYKSLVLRSFPRLCGKRTPFRLGWCGSRMAAFVGREDAEKVAEGDYLVSLKVDGERVSVLVGPVNPRTGNHDLVFIGRDGKPFELRGWGARPLFVQAARRGASMPFRGMLLDGELIGGSEPQLCIFDVICANSDYTRRNPGNPVGSLPLVRRLSVMRAISTWFRDSVNGLRINNVPYLSLASLKGRDILAAVRERTRAVLGDVSDDGLILAPKMARMPWTPVIVAPLAPEASRQVN